MKKINPADLIYDKYSCRFNTEHYEFFCRKDSYAFTHIAEIAINQEKCYRAITSALKIYPDFKIKYLIADNPYDLGVIYGDNQPCNGFARIPNEIFAVYNEKIKCVGMHEDVHIISFSVNKPKYNFIVEGLAMYFDGQWQGKDNTKICKSLLKTDELPDIVSLLNNEKFFSLDENVTYPVAGAFTKFLIEKLAIEQFLDRIYYNDEIYNQLSAVFGGGKNVDNEFKEWLNRQ